MFHLSHQSFFASIIVSFPWHWWAAIAMCFIAIVLGMIAKFLWGRSVSHYLLLIYHKMVHRTADYKRDNDTERLEAAESYREDCSESLFFTKVRDSGHQRRNGLKSFLVVMYPSGSQHSGTRASSKE